MPEPQEQAEQLRKDYSTVFKSEAGERVLIDLKKTCFYDSPTIHDSNNHFAFNEGSRSVVLHILNKLKLSAEKLKELQNER